MMKFAEMFSNRHVVLPVVHVQSSAQSTRNAKIAHRTGCDGVFLINHGMTSGQLMTIFDDVRSALPGFWIGLNCLDLQPHEVFARIPSDVGAVWVDNAMVNERNDAQPDADRVRKHRTASKWSGLYFGGVAFKYQREVDDLASAARRAMAYVDIVTTSGPGTGEDGGAREDRGNPRRHRI